MEKQRKIIEQALSWTETLREIGEEGDATFEEHGIAIRWIENLAWSAETSARKIEQFAEKFLEDPAYALSWSREEFQYAARLEISCRLLNIAMSSCLFCETPWTPTEAAKDAVAYALREAVSSATNPQHSTSLPSNFMHQCRGEVYGRIYQDTPEELK